MFFNVTELFPLLWFQAIIPLLWFQAKEIVMNLSPSPTAPVSSRYVPGAPGFDAVENRGESGRVGVNKRFAVTPRRRYGRVPVSPRFTPVSLRQIPMSLRHWYGFITASLR